MKTVTALEDLVPPDEGSALTIGTFDGVHLGHRSLIAQTLEAARSLGAVATMLTWDGHPAATLRPDKIPPLLSGKERKSELVAEAGIETLAMVPFDVPLSRLSPQDFVADVLVKRMGVRSVHIGHNWRFGHAAKGDVGLLKELGSVHGFEVSGVDLHSLDGAPVTSSRTRDAIAEGDVQLAAALLGRPFDLTGQVVRGEGRGRTLGFPTANIEVAPDLARPGLGIYAGVAEVGGSRYRAAISVGTNPTFGAGQPVRIEAYLLDFDRAIYDEAVTLEFHERLRQELTFDSTEALVSQIEADVAAARASIADPS